LNSTIKNVTKYDDNMYDFAINSALDMFFALTLGINMNSSNKLNLDDNIKEFILNNYNFF